ncbi:hypothetical protein BFP97_13960 [Roseivirga sp. 4D4]|nr:hypothetical protein BFP97_13960 [Roseivirga sp. 4D4]
MNSFPYRESFEQTFNTGTNTYFIPNWKGNTIGTRNRIFAGASPRTGDQSLNIIPTSSFKGIIEIDLDLTGINNPRISFFAFSQRNGSSSSTRPVLLSLSTSIDGGLSFSTNTLIGNENTFPNNDSTSYAEYFYELPLEASGQSQVVVRLTAERGSGSGSAAELIIDDFSIESQKLPVELVSAQATSKNSVELNFNQPISKESAEQVINYSVNQGVVINAAQLITSNTVRLSTSLLENGHYSVFAKGIESDSGENTSDTLKANFTFIEPLEVLEVEVIDQRTLALLFNLELDDSLAMIPSHYAITPKIGQPIMVGLDSQFQNRITLELEEDLEEETYELSINGLRDRSLLAIANDLIKTFNYLPLTVSDISINSSTEIDLTFNQPVESNSALELTNYDLNFGLKAIFSALTDSTVHLKLNRPLVNNTYTITINNVINQSGNAIAENIIINLRNEISTPPRAILINEIFADPSGDHEPNPSVLPNDSRDEYIELFNNTLTAIDITGFDLSGGTLNHFVLMPNAYVIATALSNVEKFQSFGDVVGVSSWNGLSNNGETIVLVDDLGNTIDSISYDQSWYNDLDKSDGGWSIELINPNPSCIGAHNWSSSMSDQGGTPGYQNSIYDPSPDTRAPKVDTFLLLNDSTLQISFNQTMDVTSLIPSNFSLSHGLSIKNLSIRNDLGTDLLVHLDKLPVPGIIHDIRLSGIRDCSGNGIEEVILDFFIGASPEFNDLLITEIMATPSPSQGLPEAEYIELYNNSEKIIGLGGMTLADAINSTSLDDFTLFPHQHIILTANNVSDQFTAFGQVLGVSNWVSLNNSGDQLSIYNQNGTLVHSVEYSDTWYRSETKANGGYSLEMIDPNYPCLEERNWIASKSPSGGTPGQVNAANDDNPDLLGPKLIRAIALDASTIELLFDEKLDVSTVQSSKFKGDQGLSFISAIVNEDGRTIQLTTNEDLIENTVYTISVDNITDCSGNLIQESSDSIELIVASSADSQDVIINEILFNPRSGGVRFVEVYNNSPKYINLKDWKLAGSTNERTLSSENLFMAPQSYFVITNDGTTLQEQYPNARSETFIELLSMPSIPSDSGELSLLNSATTVIDSLSYNEDYHSPLLPDPRGVSLERINFSQPSNSRDSWFSASSTEYSATPGYANSQSRPMFSQTGEISIEPLTFDPESSRAANFVTINYSFISSGNTLNISIIDAQGNRIRELTQNTIAGREGTIIWDGTTDQSQKARVGYYMILTEIISRDGTIRYSKNKVAVGTLF